MLEIDSVDIKGIILTMKITDSEHLSALLMAISTVFGGALFVALLSAFVPSYMGATAVESTAPAPTPAPREIVQGPASESATNLSEYGFDNYRVVSLSSLPRLGEELEQPVAQPEAAPSTDDYAVEPERIQIGAIGMDLPIANPQSRQVDDLDHALLSGPVRYPDSALLNQDGNILVFAHSSHLPVVRNQMFKAFNDLPNLEKGDTITVTGGGKKHLYRVDVVRQTDANEELIDLSPTGGERLTLSTCDTFGAKSARWIVEAEFVGAFDAGTSGA